MPRVAEGTVLYEGQVPSDITEYTCDDSLCVIGYRAFYAQRYLERIFFSSRLSTIGSEAFRQCSALRIVVIPDSVDYIRSNAFLDCTRLHKIVIPSHTIVSTGAFEMCASLVDVVIKPTPDPLRPFVYPGRCVVRIWTDTDVEVPNAFPFVIIGPGVPTLKLLHKWVFALHWHWTFPTRMLLGQRNRFTLVVYCQNLPLELVHLVWTYVPRNIF
jgi:hypothetical protein